MDNLSGALGFQASLDIDDFNVSSQAMERRIQQVASTAVQSGAEMEGVFNRAATAFAGIVGLGAAKSFVQQMINVRSEMQNTEASFKVFLGTAERANEFFSSLQRYAYNNVFEFADLAKSASQLLAFRNNVEDVIPIIDKLSNIAAGANAPLAEFVSLFNKAKANNKLLSVDIQMWESRGVPVVHELAEAYGKSEAQIRQMVTAGKVGFKDLETVITKLTDRGGMFAGMMVEKMKTLGDSIGLLQDNITNMFNELGQANQGVLRAGILAVNSLVENYETVGRVLGSLVTVYGTYKAAVIATNLAMKNGTGISILDNTVKALKVHLLKQEQQMNGTNVVSTKAVKEAQAALNAKQQEYIAGLKAQLTEEQLLEVTHKARIAAMTALLTAEQAQQLETLGITVTDANYEQMVLGVLTAEQREALSKVDLTSKGALYQAQLEREVAAKSQELAMSQRSIDAKRQEVSAAHARMEAYKESAFAAQAAVESAKYEVYWAKQSGDATRIATAEKKLEAAQENASVATKTALGARSEFLAQKKELEAMTSRKVTAANGAEAASEIVDAGAKNVNTGATSRLTVAVKALWAAIKANPLGLVISIVGSLLALLPFLKKRTDENSDAATEFTDAVNVEIANLKLYKSILESTERNTKSYKDALQKLNTVCTQYNVQLKDEQGNVRELAGLYDELTLAIQRSAKAKITASNTELINREAQETEADALKSLKKRAGRAKYTDYETDEYGDSVTMTTHKSASLRNASAAIWEGVETLALDGAKTVVSDEGEIIEEQFESLLRSIMERVQTVTGASDREMAAFTADMKKYLKAVMEAEAEAVRQTKELNKQLDGLFQDNGSTTTQKKDYSKMSFEELAEEAKGIQASIDEINSKPVRVAADDAELKQLLATLGEINSAVDAKENGLNTESDINARIKQLKALKEQSVINSAEYKSYESQIKKLQSKLPKTAETIAQQQQQLSQKQTDAQLKLEEARIAVIEDSWEREQAMRELQHQRSLAQIEKEKQELIKARKTAGKGGLSKEEESSFQERVNLENQAYEKQQRNLTDNEIAYRKSQYDLYWKWVQHLGKDVADAQFKQLLSAGSSYSQWIDNELAKLGSRGEDGKFSPNAGNTEDQNRRFVVLAQERDVIMGAKSAMDVFQESVSRAVQEAGSLAEKLQAVADAKQQIADGESGLNEDEQAAALVSLDKQEADLQREVTNTLLSDFQTFEEQRLEIQNQYQLLRNEALKEGNEERLRLVNEGEQQALSELQGQILMQSDSWKNLFQNLDALTVSEITRLIQDIETKMATADLKLAPADYQALMDSLNKAKQQVAEKNPFKALTAYCKEYIAAARKAKTATGDEAKAAQQQMVSAGQGLTASIGNITNACSTIGNSLSGVFDSFGMDEVADGIGDAMDLMGGLGTTAAGVGKIMSGDILGGITDIISGLSQIIITANGMSDKQREKDIVKLQEDIDGLSKTYEKLSKAMEKTYWVYTDEERAAMGAKQADMKALHEQQIQNLKDQQVAIRQQIALEEDKKKTDKEKVQNWKDSLEDLEDTISELEDSWAEMLSGTSVSSAIDEFGDALWDAIMEGNNAMDVLDGKIKDVLRNAVKESLKRQFLAKGINDAIEYLSTAMEDSVLTDEEREKFEAMAGAAGERYKEAIEALGDWVYGDDRQEDALTGAVRSMTEETGGLVAGRLNAVVINQAADMELSRQSLVYLAAMNNNVEIIANAIRDVREDVRKLATGEYNLLSQGIS